MDNRERLARRIRRLREDMGSRTRSLSRDDLARELSERLRRTSPPIAGSTIEKWERPTSSGPDPWVLVELARLAEVPVDQFVYPSDEEITLRADGEDAFADGAEIPAPPQVPFTGDEASEESKTAERRRRR